jgi:hypothetical protein
MINQAKPSTNPRRIQMIQGSTLLTKPTTETAPPVIITAAPVTVSTRLKVCYELLASILIGRTYNHLTSDADDYYTHIGPDRDGYAQFLTELDLEHMDDQEEAETIALPQITPAYINAKIAGANPLPLFEAIVIATREVLTTWLYQQRHRIEQV